MHRGSQVGKAQDSEAGHFDSERRSWEGSAAQLLPSLKLVIQPPPHTKVQ